MSLRYDKIKRLQESQKHLKSQKSSTEVLQMQQRALKKSLLINKPRAENKQAKRERLRVNQLVSKNLKLKREEEKKQRERILKSMNQNKLEGFSFNKRKANKNIKSAYIMEY